MKLLSSVRTVIMLTGLTMLFACSVSYAAKHQIGEEYGGGIVFYVDSTGEHGLIAAKQDINTTYTEYHGKSYKRTGYYKWSAAELKKRPNEVECVYSIRYQPVNNTSPALGQGLANTIKFLAKNSANKYPNTAAAVAHGYHGGDYDDWYLPSKDELNQLYIHRDLIGGFSSYHYWSSSEFATQAAWYQNFCDGIQTVYFKYKCCRVRPVRDF